MFRGHRVQRFAGDICEGTILIAAPPGAAACALMSNQGGGNGLS